ncbi:MAG: ATP-binding cassette domain-containing protein [Candidatus Dormibacteraeota bacterium]|nr:ATP-binding cassette domain-containing protein [Candidatus Dormibacteraeota bacterium]
MTVPGLSLRRLVVRRFGRTVLDIAELDIAEGGLAVLTGGSASGKTTLAAALAGSLACEGQVRVAGRPLDGPPSHRRRRLTAAVRDGERVTGCTVEEALRLAAGGTARLQVAFDALPQIGSRRRLDCGLLSGGEQQLLQVAAAWATAPEVLVLDSPTVGLAADAASTVTELARQHAADGGTVLWLEQDGRVAPAAPLASLVRGRLAPAAVSSPASG